MQECRRQNADKSTAGASPAIGTTYESTSLTFFVSSPSLRRRADFVSPRQKGHPMPTKRPDRSGTHQAQFRTNKKKIYATQTVCGICGKPVDFSLKYPHPLSACIDHIIPVAKGGHPSDLNNLQLAHWTCNRQKSDKLVQKQEFSQLPELVSNRNLPQSFDWRTV